MTLCELVDRLFLVKRVGGDGKTGILYLTLTLTLTLTSVKLYLNLTLTLTLTFLSGNVSKWKSTPRFR